MVTAFGGRICSVAHRWRWIVFGRLERQADVTANARGRTNQFGEWLQRIQMLRDDNRDDDDEDAEPHPPDAPQPAPESREMSTAAEFMWAMRPVIHVVTNVPTRVATASDAPATSSAMPRDPNCMKAAIAVAAAAIPGPR